MRRKLLDVTTLGPDEPGLVTLANGSVMDCEAYKREAEKTMAIIDGLSARERALVHERGVTAVPRRALYRSYR